MKNRYSMSVAQIENFARDMATAIDSVSNGRTTYLRVLVAGIQGTLGKVKRGRNLGADTQLDVLGDVSDRYYAAVLKGVTTPDIEHAEGLDKAESTRRSVERNRRSTFARSAKSVLSSWINTGGDIRNLDVDTVTRDPLLADIRERRGQSSTAYTMGRYAASIIRAATRAALQDPLAAREELQTLIQRLETVRDGLGSNPVEASTITQVLASRPAHTRQPRSGSRLQA